MQSIGTDGQKPVLTLQSVSKKFGGVVAADQIHIDLIPGEIFGLIGPNGAGKTTVINLITGLYAVDGGSIFLADENITKYSCHKRARRGIARTFQHPRLLQRCDIKTNLFLGMDLAARKKLGTHGAHMVLLERLLAAADLRVTLTDSIDKMSYGQQKLMEIIRAILTQPRVLLLDEPAAGLNHREMEHVTALIEIAVEMGVAVLLIEHAMDLVMKLCDRLTVLNFGHQIADGVPAEIQDNPAVIEAYLGRNRNAFDS